MAEKIEVGPNLSFTVDNVSHGISFGVVDRGSPSYAVRRPDCHWALLLINKDRDHAHPVRISFEDGSHVGHFSGSIRTVRYGSEQNVWHGKDASAHADPNLPPVVSSVDAAAETVFTLPKASVSVLRGEVAGLTA